MHGWAGTIIHVDLTSRKFDYLDTGRYCDAYIGGLGIGERLYWDMAPPDADAFSPESPLILMTGPLAATTAPSAPRLTACGKAPCIYPEHFACANLGGRFATDLKRAGYDGIVLTGKADRPVYINIENESVELKPAGHLWGLGNLQTRKILQESHGSDRGIISIGPAGEILTRFAILFSDAGSAASMGFGAVMGAKNVKALVARGSGRISIADPEAVLAIRKQYQEMTGDGYFNLFSNPITLPGSRVLKKVHCQGCPQGCWRSLHQSPAGTEDLRKCQVGNFYMMWDKRLHGNCTEISFDAPRMANDFGVCIMDTVFLLIWMDKCAAQGLLDKAATGLDFSKMGSREFLEACFQKIRSREGFGRLMADGVRRTAMAVGGQAEKVADDMLTASGRAIAYGPKVFSMAAPIYATEPRPFITELHEICEPLTKWALWHLSGGEKTKVSTDVLRRIAAAFWGSKEAVDFSTVQGKALAALKIQNRQYIKESLNLCDFAWPLYDSIAGPDHVGDPTMEERLYGAVTGRQIDTAGIDLIAERLFTLNRAILIREGRRGRKDDRLPEFMFIERKDMIADAFGMHNPELLLPGRGDEILCRRGKALDRQDFEQMMDEYYRLRGWDVQTGIPTAETLARLSLSEVSAAISK